MSRFNQSHLFVVFFLLAAAIPNLIIITYGFSYLGFTLSIAALATVLFGIKQKKSLFDTFLFVSTLFFSFFIFYRAYPFLIFLNIIATIVGISLLFITHTKLTSFIAVGFSPIIAFIRTLATKSTYDFNYKAYIPTLYRKQIVITEVVTSIVITIVLLLIIIPLLSSANPLFGKVVTNTLQFLNLSTLLNALWTTNYFVILIRLLGFLLLVFLLPRAATLLNQDKPLPTIPNFIANYKLFIPKVVVSFVLLVFFVTQAQLYFATAETLQSLGYTHSQYAREVFAQLSVVALIILGLLYNDTSTKRTSKIFTYILILEGFFLAGIALKSVYDYSQMWGFTHKRLWGYTGVFWIFCVFLLYLYTFSKHLTNSFFVKGVIIVSGITLLSVNIFNFDYAIFHYRKTNLPTGTDYLYLSRLSTDSASYLEQLEAIFGELKAKQVNDEGYYERRFALQDVLWKIDSLQWKYKTFDLRTFNASEYKEYNRVKNIDLEEYKNYLYSQAEKDQVQMSPPRQVPYSPSTGL